MDEAFGIICSLISPGLLFHIFSCKTPNEAWTTMEGIFGKQDKMRGPGVILRTLPKFICIINGRIPMIHRKKLKAILSII